MQRAITIMAVLAAVSGVVQATTPAVARSKQADRNLSCEASPPNADVVTTKQGGVNLQLPGFGIGGERTRATARTDVIISAEGRDGWFDLDLYAKACRAAILTWPNNPNRQLQELMKFRESLRRSQQAKAHSDTPFKLSETDIQAFLGASTGPVAAAPAPPPAQVPAPAGAQWAPGAKAPPAPAPANQQQPVFSIDLFAAGSRTRPRAPAAPTATFNVSGNPLFDPLATPEPKTAASPPHGTGDLADTTVRPRGRAATQSYSATQNCSQFAASGGLMVSGCPPITTQTCTTSQPMTIPGMAMVIGNIVMPGMPITVGSPQTTCSTTTTF